MGDEVPDDAVVHVGDELDLHTFRPKDLPSLIPEFIDECVRQGYATARIVHGKGKGVQRRTVHALLERHPMVESYKLADMTSGGWGATMLTFKSGARSI